MYVVGGEVTLTSGRRWTASTTTTRGKRELGRVHLTIISVAGVIKLGGGGGDGDGAGLVLRHPFTSCPDERLHAAGLLLAAAAHVV